ncbi:MAG: pyridoxal-phosphate dependent enzyme [Colwellia sp.]|nr:pyridoxal-phosphate dependent enzyme [Colwellia sp.]MCW9082166.1 pyridoxal-phosphate dependent enzyme [Colwellia sp.]
MISPSKTQHLQHPFFDEYKVQVSVKRDDSIHPIISGNKWRKLKYNLAFIKQQKKITGAISFGGSYSNHIHAFAFACHQQGIPCIGIIRGEAGYADNYTLTWARHWGMQLHFVDRKTYRRRHDSDYITELQKQFPNYFIIPEGGSNELAIPGVAEVMSELKHQCQFDTLLTPVGSGGTLAGLITGDEEHNENVHKLLGVAVLKGADYLVDEVKALLPEKAKRHQNWQVLTEYHCGGYAKFSLEDAKRILEFNHITGVDFEPVYSGKMVLALLNLLAQGYFNAGERIVLLHTGGMQGLGGMIERGILTAEQWPIPLIDR